MDDRTQPDKPTRKAERAEAQSAHQAGREPSAEEELAADEEYSATDEVERKDVGEHYREMTELGASVKGEGEIE